MEREEKIKKDEYQVNISTFVRMTPQGGLPVRFVERVDGVLLVGREVQGLVILSPVDARGTWHDSFGRFAQSIDPN